MYDCYSALCGDEEGGGSFVSTSPPSMALSSEAFVISGSQEAFDRFLADNRAFPIVKWKRAFDGWNQSTVNLFAELANVPPLNVTQFNKLDLAQHGDFESPHAIGCYLSHWTLLRSLYQRLNTSHSTAYFIFEDDAVCIPDAVQETLALIRLLPEDWDMIYTGSKVFTFFPGNDLARASSTDYSNSTADLDSLRNDICRGFFGKGESPLAPDGSSRTLDAKRDPYWITRYTTNTESYVVNPKRLGHILNMVKPKAYIPYDIVLGDAMRGKKLNVFMPTRRFCGQRGAVGDIRLNESLLGESWQGYFCFLNHRLAPNNTHPFFVENAGVGGYCYWQRQIQLDNCVF